MMAPLSSILQLNFLSETKNEEWFEIKDKRNYNSSMHPPKKMGVTRKKD